MRRAPVSSRVTYRVEHPDGSARMLCDPDCARRYITAIGTSDKLLKTDPRNLNTCHAHCAWCGVLVATPVSVCVICDDEECPEFGPLMTVRAMVAVRRLTERARRPLPPRAFQYLEDAAGGYWVIGLEGTAEQLVEQVWALRSDWLWATG